MEQRIGSSSQPLDTAAVDPAYIPGLTSPVSAEAVKATGPRKPEATEDSKDSEAAESTAETVPGGPDEESAAAPGEAGTAERPEDATESEESASAAEEDTKGTTSDGPVFEAADRRARIVADASGVRLKLDDQECEFRWDEIAALETEVPRFGKRYTVTVHTPDRRWYPIEIEAPSRSRFQEWDTQLDAVLDAFFDDGEAAEAAEAERKAEADAAETSEEPEKAAEPEKPAKSAKLAKSDASAKPAADEKPTAAAKPDAAVKQDESGKADAEDSAS